MKKRISIKDVLNKKEMPCIQEIIKIEPFKITVIWNTGEIKVVEFEPIFEYWDSTEGKTPDKMKDFKEFAKVSIIDNTLGWKNIKLTNSALTIDPEGIYESSKPLDDYILVKKQSQLSETKFTKIFI